MYLTYEYKHAFKTFTPAEIMQYILKGYRQLPNPNTTYHKTRTIVLNYTTNAKHIPNIVGLPEEFDNSYFTFQIPKHSGGVRTITAPNAELKQIQRHINYWLQTTLRVLPHDSAFAYVKERSSLNALAVHQQNNSKWFLKIDLQDFFPSCTEAVLKDQLFQIFPFSIQPDLLEDILPYVLLDGALPQGAPTSPYLSNLLMVPFDYHLTKKLWNFNKQHFVYTRYADDILISSQYDFKTYDIIKLIQLILTNLNLPFDINQSKTRYGSSSGRNWNLGLMLNKDNVITIGHRKKERIRATLHHFIVSDDWDLLSTQQLYGQLNYAKQIEPEFVENLYRKYTEKFNVDVAELFKQRL